MFQTAAKAAALPTAASPQRVNGSAVWASLVSIGTMFGALHSGSPARHRPALRRWRHSALVIAGLLTSGLPKPNHSDLAMIARTASRCSGVSCIS